MRRDRWTALAALAATQHGLATPAQARALGIDHGGLQRALASGLLVPVRRNVMRVAGSPVSRWDDVMAACLAAGPRAVASHRSAGLLYGLPVAPPPEPEILCGEQVAEQLSGVGGHRSHRLPMDHCIIVENVPCTIVERTIVDLASRYRHRRPALAALVDDADRRGLCRPADIEKCLDGIRSRGRWGAAVLRDILADRVSAGSPLEAQWLRRLKVAEVPAPVLQHQLVVRGHVLLLDAAWPDQRVALEVDGWSPHRTRQTFDRDADKANLLVDAAWRVVHATSRSAPEAVISQIRRLLAA